MNTEDLLKGIREIIKEELGDFKDEMNGFREEMYDFKEEMYDFKEEMYDFREEMNGFQKVMYDFRDEMYDFRDEMYDFKAKTEDDIAIIKRAVLELSSDMKDMKNHTHNVSRPVRYKRKKKEIDYIREEENNE